MSRGPGVWQRQILDITEAGKRAILTSAEFDHATQNAIRRAAHTLAAAGKVKLTSEHVDGVARLVAAPLDDDIPAPRRVTGLDGKTYLLPARSFGVSE